MRKWAVLLALGAWLAAGAPARAEARLVASVPAAEATWSEVPAEVRLEFSEPVVAEMSTVTLLDQRGRIVGGTRLRRADERTLVLEVPPQPRPAQRATYYVQAQVVGQDMKVSRERVRFFVAGTGAPATGGGARISWGWLAALAAAVAGVVVLLVRRGAGAA